MQKQQHQPLNTTIQALFHEQIKKEKESSHHYLAMATWSDIKNYTGSAEFLYKQAQEERQHMIKLIKYLIEQNIQPILPSVATIQPSYTSLHHLFKKVLEQEKKITASIHHIVEQSLQHQDYTTFNFLQWFLHEQREEELQAQKILDLFEIIDQKGIGLYTIDQAIAKLTKHEAEIA